MKRNGTFFLSSSPNHGINAIIMIIKKREIKRERDFLINMNGGSCSGVRGIGGHFRDRIWSICVDCEVMIFLWLLKVVVIVLSHLFDL